MSDTANRFPPGWDEERVRDVIEHCEAQTNDELAEIEAAFEGKSQTVMVIPNEIVPAVKALLAESPDRAPASDQALADGEQRQDTKASRWVRLGARRPVHRRRDASGSPILGGGAAVAIAHPIQSSRSAWPSGFGGHGPRGSAG